MFLLFLLKNSRNKAKGCCCLLHKHWRHIQNAVVSKMGLNEIRVVLKTLSGSVECPNSRGVSLIRFRAQQGLALFIQQFPNTHKISMLCFVLISQGNVHFSSRSRKLVDLKTIFKLTRQKNSNLLLVVLLLLTALQNLTNG